ISVKNIRMVIVSWLIQSPRIFVLVLVVVVVVVVVVAVAVAVAFTLFPLVALVIVVALAFPFFILTPILFILTSFCDEKILLDFFVIIALYRRLFVAIVVGRKLFKMPDSSAEVSHEHVAIHESVIGETVRIESTVVETITYILT